MAIEHPIFSDNFTLMANSNSVNIVFLAMMAAGIAQPGPEKGQQQFPLASMPVAQIAMSMTDFQRFAEMCHNAVKTLPEVMGEKHEEVK
mgnify:CR=1 FL=1